MFCDSCVFPGSSKCFTHACMYVSVYHILNQVEQTLHPRLRRPTTTERHVQEVAGRLHQAGARPAGDREVEQWSGLPWDFVVP